MQITYMEKSVYKVFEIYSLGKYHDFYLKNDTLLLVDLFENFRNICIKIYELDPAKFLLTPWLTWQAALKKTQKN